MFMHKIIWTFWQLPLMQFLINTTKSLCSVSKDKCVSVYISHVIKISIYSEFWSQHSELPHSYVQLITLRLQ